MLASTLLTLAGFVSYSTAGYVLQDNYDPGNFFSKFNFFTGNDPTHGYVNYVDQGTAQGQGLIGQRDGKIYIGVDHTNIASGRGRNSIRLESKNRYTRGLVLLDLQHMPGGQCGSWPAFWMFGPNWPNSGEIDIIEGVNSQTANKMALHTRAGCSITNTGTFSGTIATSNCDVNAPGQPANAGCGIGSYDTATYGAGFNAVGGGVYATEWTSNAISIWFFRRGQIPGDINSGNPNPASWGRPLARFEGSCRIDDFFRDNNIIFDVTYCGDWAGNVWNQDPVCRTKAPTCQAFVQNNPGAFRDAYWLVNSLKVYGNNGVAQNVLMEYPESNADATAQAEAPAFNETIITTAPAQEASPAPTPMLTTLATEPAQKPKHKTVSALQADQFGSSKQGQHGAGKHARHLLKHQHKDHA